MATGEAAEVVRVAHLLSRCDTLGPGRRGVVWVQGCARRCPGCVAGPILGPGGTPIAVEALAERVLGWEGIDGLTLSGGEPFEQAAALARLCRLLRRRRDLSILAYSGFLLEEIAADPGRRALLAELDVLVDGPFERARRADLLWRGSDNQRVHLLTDRHRALAGALDGPGAGVELHVGRDGGVFWAGVPEPGFGARLARQLAAEGIDVTDTGGMWA